MIGIEVFILISLLCLQSHELFRIAPSVVRNFNIYTVINFSQVALTTVLLWTFIHLNISETTACLALSYYMAHSYAVATWCQDFIMLTRIRIFDETMFKRSLVLFAPLLIARVVTNLDTAVSIRPVQVTPTLCDVGYPGDRTGRQNIVKAVTYFVEICVLVFLVVRHLRRFNNMDTIARKFLIKTAVICVISLTLATSFSLLLLLGIEASHSLMWFGLINSTISISDSFLARSITAAFMERNCISLKPSTVQSTKSVSV
ncbi:hypothetical protein BKA69DRAFT_1134350 [Paraphysoderma sedebokerense]|nr:hypothetical protein BKA69DRAFT_1134350 [Paraphysoderma sedebokerense]